MQTNSPLPATLMMRGCQIHGVQLDELWREQSRAAWSRVHRLFAEGLESGEVVPLQYTVFTDVARALKFITSGKHKGKVRGLEIPSGTSDLCWIPWVSWVLLTFFWEPWVTRVYIHWVTF